MKKNTANHAEIFYQGDGCYTVPEAARLLKIPASSIHRWLGGYSYRKAGEKIIIDPLWLPQYRFENHIELNFRDLIELRFVKAFLKAGLGLKTIRFCIENAREMVDDYRPFSTFKFQTDGQTIFLERVLRPENTEIVDLRKNQYVFKDVIKNTFCDLDIEHEAVTKWRPFNGKQSIVIDPERSFGQPIAAEAGIPTIILADAVRAEASIERVAYLYDVSPLVVQDAVEFEEMLMAA